MAHEFLTILSLHMHKYKEMQLQDYLKLTYQYTFGSEHFIQDEKHSFDVLKKEYATIEKAINSDVSYDEIGHGLLRYPLQCLNTSPLSLEQFHRLFLYSSKRTTCTYHDYMSHLLILKGFLSKHHPAFLFELDTYLKTIKEPCHPISHSVHFKEVYSPSYRLVDEAIIKYHELFKKIHCVLQESQQVVIAIDGMSGSGKSTMAALLKAVYEANVFHMDDFFLQPNQRSTERLSQAGGNVDYERFKYEALDPLLKQQDLLYTPYNCSTKSLVEPIPVKHNRVTIVEGAYSMHPYFEQPYDISVFLSIDKTLQKKRILSRNGSAMLERFIHEWIPMEHDYFNIFHIQELCDFNYE